MLRVLCSAGRYVKLEKLEEAHADFSTGLKIDYDEDTEDAAKAVGEKVKEMNATKVRATPVHRQFPFDGQAVRSHF